VNRHLLRGLLALYPRAFRDRYGTELARLTDELVRAGEITPLLAVLNLAGGAALEWGRVLTGSRRAALAVAAAAVMAATGSLVVAAAGLFYVTGHARPHSTAASAHSPSAPAVTGQPAAGCAFGAYPAGRLIFKVVAGTSVAATTGHASQVVMVPEVVLVPGQPGTETSPSSSPVPVLVPASSAGTCVILFPPPPPGSNPAPVVIWVASSY
jgi:hypothetical protein